MCIVNGKISLSHFSVYIMLVTEKAVLHISTASYSTYMPCAVLVDYHTSSQFYLKHVLKA